MNNNYKRPEIAVIPFNTDDIIMESTGNVLKTASYNAQNDITKSVVFDNTWIDSYFEQ